MLHQQQRTSSSYIAGQPLFLLLGLYTHSAETVGKRECEEEGSRHSSKSQHTRFPSWVNLLFWNGGQCRSHRGVKCRCLLFWNDRLLELSLRKSPQHLKGGLRLVHRNHVASIVNLEETECPMALQHSSLCVID